MEPRNTIFLTIFCLISQAIFPITASPDVTAVFAFGDSTVDSGNNNHVNTLFRSNHTPYGQDFPGHVSSGRFSDGKLATDYIVASLGLKEFLPAYMDPNLTDDDLLTGVSFGSAGSGLDERTAALSQVLDIQTQLEYFDQAVQRMERRVGAAGAGEIVNKALFFISVGTNDLLYNFYDVPVRPFGYSISSYHNFLHQKLESVIQRLYKAGARRFAVVGHPPIGCLPIQVTVSSIIPSQHFLQRVCVDQQNIDSQAYNEKLQALTSSFDAKLNGAKVSYLDIYNPIMDMIVNSTKYGFETTLRGCCGTGLVELGPLCNDHSPTCPDASKYLFWDAIHLTQAAYKVIANISGQTVLPQLLH